MLAVGGAALRGGWRERSGGARHGKTARAAAWGACRFRCSGARGGCVRSSVRCTKDTNDQFYGRGTEVSPQQAKVAKKPGHASVLPTLATRSAVRCQSESVH